MGQLFLLSIRIYSLTALSVKLRNESISKQTKKERS